MTEPTAAHDQPSRRSLIIGLGLGAVFLLAAVALIWQQATSDDTPSDDPTTTTAAIADEVAASDLAANRVLLEGLRGERYCEILAVTSQDGSNIAEVWNTIELNDCPDAAWDAIDMGQAATDLGVDLAIRNGPRLWSIDSIEKVTDGEEAPVRDFGGVEMRVVATVDIGPSLAEAAARYEVREVDRRTVFTWDADRSVGILTDPDGDEFVLQAWSIQQADDLGEDALPTLADRLSLPDGWTFAVRELTEPLVVDTTGAPARVLQDDLGNAYTQLPG